MPQEGLRLPSQALSPDRATEEPILLPAIARLGLPVFLFGAMFFLLMIGIMFLMAPDRFPVRVGEKAVRLSELEAEEHRLQEKRASLEDMRAALNLEEKAPILHSVSRLKKNVVPAGRALLAIEDVRAGFRTSSIDPISLPRIEIAGKSRSITIGGEVRDPGGRSMQMLASFVDGLRDIPLVESVTEPEYVSNSLKEGATVSPFVMTLTLKHE